MKAKILSILVLVLLLSAGLVAAMPATPALAANGHFGGGNGTASNPYLITDVYDLQAMQNNLGAYYALAKNIDASATSGWNGGAGFAPIGTSQSNSFTGRLDGRGYAITGLNIRRSTTTAVGLFGYIGTKGVVTNLKLNAYINGGNGVGAIAGINAGLVTLSGSTGAIYANYGYGGGLLGYNWGTVSNTYSTANVGGVGNIGGLVGYDTGAVQGSYATGTVSSVALNGYNGYDAGGLVGYITNTGTVTNSYARGKVLGTWYVGGLAGENYGTVRNSYSTGAPSGTNKYYVGGLTGGMCGQNWAGKTSNCFWDTQTSGTPNTAPSCAGGNGGTGKTTTQMKTKSTFTSAGWDFTYVWGINSAINNGYPYLLLQH